MDDAALRRQALGVLLPAFVGPALPDWLAEALDDGLAGVCLFAHNIEDPVQLRALTASIRARRADAIVAVDEEGGDVTRLHARDGSPEPGNAVLGRLDDETTTAASARRIGRELREAGCTLDLAPDADANTDDDNPVIGARSFGSDAALVARHTAAWVRGLQSTGVAACAKHFPGHGDTAVDSHLGLPVVDRDLAELQARELLPFAAAIAAGAASIMTSHILLPQLDADAPATMSAAILTGLLREGMGFGGAIVTDALDMRGASGGIGIPAAAVRSLRAGADLLCLGSDSAAYFADVVDAVMAAVRSGELDGARLQDAADRTARLAAFAPVGSAPDAPPPSAAAIADVFDVRPRAARLLAEPGPWSVVRLEGEPNIAVGEGAWGPDAAVTEDPSSAATQDWLEWSETPQDGVRVLAVGRDVHLHPEARSVVDRLREAGPVLAVDLGWPGADRRYADVATFGGSRAVGAALLDLLAGAAAPATSPSPVNSSSTNAEP